MLIRYIAPVVYTHNRFFRDFNCNVGFLVLTAFAEAFAAFFLFRRLFLGAVVLLIDYDHPFFHLQKNPALTCFVRCLGCRAFR